MQALALAMLQAKARSPVPSPAVAPTATAPAAPGASTAPASSRSWEITIIRGGSVEKVQFPLAPEDTMLSREGT
jgi:hypothetical protein